MCQMCHIFPLDFYRKEECRKSLIYCLRFPYDLIGFRPSLLQEAIFVYLRFDSRPQALHRRLERGKPFVVTLVAARRVHLLLALRVDLHALEELADVVVRCVRIRLGLPVVIPPQLPPRLNELLFSLFLHVA